MWTSINHIGARLAVHYTLQVLAGPVRTRDALLQEMSSMDVSGAVVNPAFRATPWKAEKAENSSRGAARIVFVSESNICRSTLAAGIMTQMLREGGLADEVEVESRVSNILKGTWG